MDGAGTIRSFFHVVLPLSKPILGAAAALSFADSWNLVEQPLIYLSSTQNAMPLSVMFNIFSSSEQGVVRCSRGVYSAVIADLFLFSGGHPAWYSTKRYEVRQA